MESRMFCRSRFGVALIGLTTVIYAYPSAQDRLKTMPGYDAAQQGSKVVISA